MSEEPAHSLSPVGQPQAHDSPVEMERILEFTEGKPENLRELIQLYLKQTGDQITQLRAAVQASQPQEVRRLAHSCAGASATCGMRRLVSTLRELERQGIENQLTNAQEMSEEACREFERIRVYLEDYLAKQSHVASES